MNDFSRKFETTCTLTRILILVLGTMTLTYSHLARDVFPEPSSRYACALNVYRHRCPSRLVSCCLLHFFLLQRQSRNCTHAWCSVDESLFIGYDSVLHVRLKGDVSTSLIHEERLRARIRCASASWFCFFSRICIKLETVP